MRKESLVIKKKKPKIKDYLRYISNSNEEMASAIRENNRLLIEQTEIEQKKLKHEIETKDRVDISLKEYEQLKRNLEQYKANAEHYKDIFDIMNIAEYLDSIEPNTIRITTMKDPVRLSTRVNIQFESKKFNTYG